jgi:hypothetical protein
MSAFPPHLLEPISLDRMPDRHENKCRKAVGERAFGDSRVTENPVALVIIGRSREMRECMAPADLSCARAIAYRWRTSRPHGLRTVPNGKACATGAADDGDMDLD